MNMKKYTLGIAMLFAACLVIVMISWSWRWILFNGWTATNYAVHLLAGDRPKTENSFIDYTIYTASGCVVFFTHDEEDRTMVYCPNGSPKVVDQIGTLKHVIGPWYQTR